MPVFGRILLALSLWMSVILTAASPGWGASEPAKRLTFSRAFAPSEGMVSVPERPSRQELCLNGFWQFQPVPLPAGYQPDRGDAPALPLPASAQWDKTPIKVPSPWNVNAFNQGDGGDFRCFPSYPVAWEKAQMGWLKRSFVVPNAWKGRRLRLHFEAVAGDTVVFVNGRQVGSNFDLFLPFECDVTSFIRYGEPNQVLVGVRKASLFNDTRTVGSRPYPGGSFWGQAIAGIWQDVFLEAVPALHVEDVSIRPEVSQGTLRAEVTLRNDTPHPQSFQIGGQVQPWINLAGSSVLDAPDPRWRLGKPILALPARAVTLAPGEITTVALSEKTGGRLNLWSPDTPSLYGLVLSVRQGSQVVDRRYVRFGWREFTFAGNRQLLNGKPLELRGDSWHFLGIPQMTRRYAWAWFKALKNAHGNAVRLHAQPYPRFYLDMADEMGICVLDETANWGSDGQHKYDSPEFWTRADDQVARLVLRDRNHPAVFGWSVSNEVAWFIDRDRHPTFYDRLKQGWRTWRDTADRLDPTRPWVSTDGDGDADGIMPTIVVHYGSLDGPAKGDKPYGEGESGGAYADTPKQDVRFVGPRAYESVQGRMEGVAIEAYGLLATQRKLRADYVSVFNMVWYGLQPLALGLLDTTQPPSRNDGIFFGPYEEGRPGVQPERLGPYCSTLNPGYDPRLPLYKPWPLFDAIKAAYAPQRPAPSRWEHPIVLDKPVIKPQLPRITQVAVLAGKGSILPAQLNALGATVVDAESLDRADLLLVDGTNLPPDMPLALRQKIKRWVENGATCVVWGVAPEALSSLNALLPRPVRLTERQASSLLIHSADPLLAGMDNGDFYFTETQPDPLVRHGLAGSLVDRGTVLVAASPVDWHHWNFRPEPMKTGAILRSEREAKPAGPVIVAATQGRGRYLVSTLDTNSGSPDQRSLFRRMLANAGVVLAERHITPEEAFDAFGTLKQALACGSFGAASTADAYNSDNIGISLASRPRAGNQSGGLTWRSLTAGENGIFNFLTASLPGPHENAAVYLSFWIWSPRPLDNLLLEPNLPKLDLLVGSDDGCQVWLNAHLLQEDRGTHPLTPGSLQCKAMPLQRGWNHFLVKVVQGSGEWQFRGDLRCSDPLFLTQLRTSIVDPLAEGAAKP